MLAIIEEYGQLINPKEDLNTLEAREILSFSHTKMEIVGNSYIYGYMRGTSSSRKMVPVYNLRQMTDEEWQAMARKNKLEGGISQWQWKSSKN